MDALTLEEGTRDAKGHSFLSKLLAGELDWSLMAPFPTQTEADRAAGDAVLDRVRTVLAEHVDPETIDETTSLPDGYKKLLRDNGLLRLRLPEEVGGDDLSWANLVRVLELVGSWCSPMAMSLSVHNAIGAPAFVGSVADSGTRARYLQALADGALSGFAGTEDHGASNVQYDTVARPEADGTHYVLTGRKVFIGNGPIADVLVVPVTTYRQTDDGETPEFSAFLVDTSSPGFSVESAQRYMGLRGLANGVLRFEGVRVPKENLIGAPGEALDLIVQQVPRGKLFTPALCLAVAKLCLRWSRDFVDRPYMGRPLKSYDMTRESLARAGADILAISSMLEWTANRLDEGRVDLTLELDAIKVQASELAWRTVDATMQLLAGRGYETRASLLDRGIDGAPVERFHRDIRVHRIFGTTNEIIAVSLALRMLTPFSELFAGGKVDEAGVAAALARLRTPGGEAPGPQGLSPANQKHLHFLKEAGGHLAAVGLQQMAAAGGLEQLLDRQALLRSLGSAAGDLFTMSTCLGAAASAAGTSRNALAQPLADVWCTHARRRVEGALHSAHIDDRALTVPLADELTGDDAGWLMEGVMP